MTDNPSHQDCGDYSRQPRMAEIRMLDVAVEKLAAEPGEAIFSHRPGRAYFYYIQQGAWTIEIGDAARTAPLTLSALGPGWSVSLEDGQWHRWRRVDDGQGRGAMLMGSVDQRYTVIQRMTNAVIVIPPDAPEAAIVDLAVAALVANMAAAAPNLGIQRRLAEIIQLQIIGFAQTKLLRVGAIPGAMRQDACLLRAWTAFLGAPEWNWTLAGMAEIAGLSRAAFAARFKAVVGASPMAMMRSTRVHYAAEMLRSAAPVTEIALKVGYGSDVALMRAFRQEFGQTPGAWRRAQAG